MYLTMILVVFIFPFPKIGPHFEIKQLVFLKDIIMAKTGSCKHFKVRDERTPSFKCCPLLKLGGYKIKNAPLPLKCKFSLTINFF